MFSSLVLLIFAAVFALVQGDDVSTVRDSNFDKVAKVDCGLEYRKELTEAIKNATCKPYYSRVTLNPTPEQKFNPSTVLVGRCGGQNDPDAGIVCVPTTTRLTPIPVSVLTLDDNGQYKKDPNECTVVNIEEHLTCRPECGLRATDCSAGQKLNQPSCKCECKDQEVWKQKCSGQYHTWDDKNCKCICSQQNTECTNGLTWNKKYCRCMKGDR